MPGISEPGRVVLVGNGPRFCGYVPGFERLWGILAWGTCARQQNKGEMMDIAEHGPEEAVAFLEHYQSGGCPTVGTYDVGAVRHTTDRPDAS